VDETIEGPRLNELLGLPPDTQQNGEEVYPPPLGEAHGDVIHASKPE